MKDSSYFLRTLVTLLVMALLTPLLLWGIHQGAQGMRNSPIRWIPSTFDQLVNYQWFVDEFQTRESIIVSWPDCTVDDERLVQFAEAIQDDRVAPNGMRHEDLFHDVVTGYATLRQLQDEPLLLSREKAVRRLKGTLVGKPVQVDGSESHWSCAVVILNKVGAKRTKSSIEAIEDVLEGDLALDAGDCYLAGSPVDGVAIDKESAGSIQYFLLPSTLVVLILSRLCLKSWTLTLAVIITALFGEGLVLSLVHFSGATMNAVLTVMAPLVFVLTVSAGVHLVNYYHDEVRLRGAAGATTRALANGWVPCVLAALTTSIGLGSLLISDMVPVRQFGIFSGICVIATTVLLFLVVPGIMARWPVTGRGRNPDSDSVQGRDHGAAGADEPSDPADSMFSWDRYAALVQQNWPVITLVCLGGMAFCAWGLHRVDGSIKVVNLLVPESRTVRDYRWLEDHVAPMVPIEIVLRLERTPDGEFPLNLLQQMELVRWVQRELDKFEDLDGTISAATFFPPIPAPGGFGRTAQRSILSRKLKGQRQSLIDAHYLTEEYDTDQPDASAIPIRRSWRVSARAPALGELDYGIFLEELRGHVQPVLDTYEKLGKRGISTLYTGIMPLVYDVQRTLLSDLMYSYTTALVLVGVVMVLVQRSLGAGLVAMIPNTFPTCIMFGTMGWLKIPVDIGSMMTASVALGIAVDGTLHYLNWFRRSVRDGHSKEEAVRNAFRHCARPIVQTTIICGLGLLVYSFSGFIPTRRFAWMMFTLLVVACVGDLILLPALLIGPLGKLFVPARWLPRSADQSASLTE